MERAFGLEIPRNLAEACSPRRTALLIYDMQVGVVRQIPNGPEIIARSFLYANRCPCFGGCRHQRGEPAVFGVPYVPEEELAARVEALLAATKLAAAKLKLGKR